jgi:hypothetical protein
MDDFSLLTFTYAPPAGLASDTKEVTSESESEDCSKTTISNQ